MTVCLIEEGDSEVCIDPITLIGRGRTSRRRMRVRAKFLAKSFGVIRPFFVTYHTTKPTVVFPDTYFEVMA